MTVLLALEGERSLIDAQLSRLESGVQWIKSAEISTYWGPQELRINGGSALRYLTGKHREEFNELLVRLRDGGIGVKVINLHGDKETVDDWAPNKFRPYA